MKQLTGTNRPAIHQNVTFDHTNVLPRSKNIEQRGFTSTGGTHKGSKGARLDVTIDVVQKLTVTTRNRYSVILVAPVSLFRFRTLYTHQTFPSKGFGSHLELGKILFELTSSECLTTLGKTLILCLEVFILLLVHIN